MGKVTVIIESDTTPTSVVYEIAEKLIPTEGTFETRGIKNARVYIVPSDEPEPGISDPYYARAEAPFNYKKAAEFIAKNVPSIVPAYVGERLAESEAPMESWLIGKDRSRALDKRDEAKRWIRSTAEQYGYQGG